MTVTWTSGYGLDTAEPVVEWGIKGGDRKLSPAGTLTFGQNCMCGAPARTVGWRDPGYIHTAFLKDLWPNSKYVPSVFSVLIQWTKGFDMHESLRFGFDFCIGIHTELVISWPMVHSSGVKSINSNLLHFRAKALSNML